MANNLVDGLMGAGKSYIAVNFFMWDELTNGNRHIYTNLPIKPEIIARDISKGKPVRHREILDRLHVLENKETEVRDQDGNVMMVPASKEPGAPLTPLVLNEIRCFWRFTQPNSCIILDECADWFNARDWKATEKLGAESNELQSYINHHRHYKDDLYILCQNIDDIDKQIRTKFQHLYRISNSLKENMFEWRFLRGVKWPVQFFKVHVYHPRNMKTEEDSFTQWPTQRGFRRYDSFSASERIPGKKLPAKDAASSDYGQTYWKRMSLWLGRSWQLFMWAGFAFGLVGGVGWVVWGLLTLDTTTVAGALPTGGRPNPMITATGPASSPPSANPQPQTGTQILPQRGSPQGEIPAPPKAAEPVRVILVTPNLFKTSDGKWFRKGDNYEGKRILYFTTDFIYCADGILHRTGL